MANSDSAAPLDVEAIRKAVGALPKGEWTVHDPRTLRQYGFEDDGEHIATILRELPTLLALADEAAPALAAYEPYAC
jgi:hypothetical protein